MTNFVSVVVTEPIPGQDCIKNNDNDFYTCNVMKLNNINKDYNLNFYFNLIYFIILLFFIIYLIYSLFNTIIGLIKKDYKKGKSFLIKFIISSIIFILLISLEFLLLLIAPWIY